MKKILMILEVAILLMVWVSVGAANTNTTYVILPTYAPDDDKWTPAPSPTLAATSTQTPYPTPANGDSGLYPYPAPGEDLPGLDPYPAPESEQASSLQEEQAQLEKPMRMIWRDPHRTWKFYKKNE